MMNLTMISDDLTGTVDCTSLACGCDPKVKVTVCTDGKYKIFERTEEREIMALNLSSRAIPGEEAYQCTYEAAKKLKGQKDQLIFKKMDTGFRGNAGYEIEAILDALDRKLCFILDHIAMRKTFTLYGHQYAAGQILSKSAFARDDKLKAPRESYIPAILSKQTNLPIGTVDIDAVKGGDLAAAVAEQVAAGKRILVFDAITDEDGLHVVETLNPLYPEVIWSGSTGIVQALITYLYGPIQLHAKHTETCRCIGFSGTAYQMTKDQIAYTVGQSALSVIDLDIDRILAGEKQQAADDAVESYLNENRLGHNVIMRPYVSAGNTHDSREIAATIMESLAECSQRICAKADFDRLIIIGGETSQAIFSALNVNVLYMDEPPEIGTGEGIIGDGDVAGKKFVLKGGSTGDQYSLLRMLGMWAD